MNDTPGLDYYFDRMLDDYLDSYFEEAEDRAYADDLIEDDDE
jgi:hypothetical protein